MPALIALARTVAVELRTKALVYGVEAVVGAEPFVVK
jgi:hypothetical protein